MSDSSNEIAAVKLNPSCECYKKLHLFGVPLYIGEENEEYSERHDVGYETAFQLPGVLKINETITEYPVVEENELSVVFLQMSDVIPNLADFELNVLSFWIMDVFIEGLWTAQCAWMPHEHQRATLQWIAYMFNYMQKNNPSRQEMFNNLKTVLYAPESSNVNRESDAELTGHSVKSGEKSVTHEGKLWNLPLPPEIKGSNQEDGITRRNSYSRDDLTSTTGTSDVPKSSSSSGFERAEEPSERNLRHMKTILEILYRIFGRLWTFMEIQTTFHGMPPLEEVHLPFTLNLPKPLFKAEAPLQSKGDKTGKKASLPEKTEEELEAEKQARKNDYILPLQESEEAKFYVRQLFGSFSERSVPGKGKGGRK